MSDRGELRSGAALPDGDGARAHAPRGTSSRGTVGIDLGTTNTVVAAVRGGRAHVLEDAEGHRLLPSVVSFHPNGEVLVGHAAKARRAIDARHTVASVKRLLGRTWSSPELTLARQRFAFAMREGPAEVPLVVGRGRDYALPEISAFVLRHARALAEEALGERIDRAVITVPAHFNELQRAATKVAGRVAGLEVLRILNEPTAAALAYGLGRGGRERVAVYDFGGGTFDCTLLDLNGNVFEVLATAGDSFLGGDDVDQAIAERMADAFLLQHRVDLRRDPQAFERLRQAAEQLKILLTTEPQASMPLREVAYGAFGAHLDVTFGLTRAELDRLAEPLVERTLKVTQDALALARLAPSAFDRVILVGGSTRMPIVRERVAGFFGTPLMDRLNPDEVVAVGASIQAAALTDAGRKRSVPPPPTPLDGSPSWRRSSFPAAQSIPAPPPAPLVAPPLPSTLPRSQLTALAELGADDDDDVTTIARDRAELAPIGPGSERPFESPFEGASPPVLLDVTPRALVVETAGGFCDVVIPRNAKIPCERTRAFATARDHQTTVRVRVAQGEATAFGANTFLGEVELHGLRPAPRGDVSLAVTFELDEGGTLRVRAVDPSSGREAAAMLQLVGAARESQIEALAARHAGLAEERA